MRKLINSAFKKYYGFRMHHVKHYMMHPFQVQEALLRDLLDSARDTEWGRKYHFASIKSYTQFSERLPINDYEDLKPYIERMMYGERDVLWPGEIKWFSKSSGTTSDKSKYIPVTPKNLRHCHLKGGWDAMTLLYNQYPDLEIFRAKNLVMGGSIAPFAGHPKTMVGDVSAVMISHMPFVAKPFYAPDFETALSPNMEQKIDRMVEVLPGEDIVMISGVPTWVVVLFRKILDHTGKKNIFEVWPNLRVYMHGGVSFRPYREQFQKFLPKPDFIYQEIYNASEGFFAAQDDLSSEGMALFLDNGIFYEFIHMEDWHKNQPEVVPLEAVEVGKNYAILITTNSGLWRYMPGDTVVFTSTHPYRIRVSGRTKQFVNAFGEEVMVENTDAALAETCRQTGAIASEYTVGPIYFNGGAKGGHEWLIEFDKEPADITSFNFKLDQNLQRVNSDYEAKRFKNMALEQLRLNVLPPGTFLEWMKSKGKFGGQNKIPRLANHRQYLEEILRFVEEEKI